MGETKGMDRKRTVFVFHLNENFMKINIFYINFSRTLAKDQHREYREKDREERFPRSCKY